MKPPLARIPRPAQAGSPLVGVVLILFVASAIAAVMIGNAIGSVRLTDRQSNLEIAYFAAEAGLEEATEWLIQNQHGYVPRDNAFTRTLPNGCTVNSTLTVYDLENMEVGMYAEASFRGATRKMIVPRGQVPKYTDRNIAYMNSGSGWYTAGNEYHGWVHGDNSLQIWSYDSANLLGPDFYGLVSTAASDFTGPWQHARFFAGYELNARPLNLQSIPFENYLLKAEGMEQHHEGGLVLEGSTEVFFLATGVPGQGRIYIRNERKHGSNAFRAYNLSDLTLIYIKDALTGDNKRGDLLVHGGVVDGKFTIYNDGDVIITNSVTYQNDPRDDGQMVEARDYPQPSDDSVGFISKDDIFLLRDSPKNIELFGAYLASGQRNGSTGRLGLLNYNDAVKGPLGTLTRYGSFISESMYPSGTFNSSTGLLRSGFRSKTYWDKRFLKRPPPYFPPDRTRIRFDTWALVD